MAPTSEQPAPPKKSLRIWVRNNGHVMRKKTRASYVYPRTVEAAKDPFDCATGKNKMFYLIAINLFPESKIIRPDDTDSETDMEETTQIDTNKSLSTDETDSKIEVTSGKVDKKRKRIKISPPTTYVPLQKAPESLIKSHNYNPKNLAAEDDVSSNKKISTTTTTKSSNPKDRSPVSKKCKVRRSTAASNLENKEECSKMLILSNNSNNSSLSNSTPTDSLETTTTTTNNNNNNNNNNIKIKTTVLNARKVPPAIPTIINSFHKIIQNCSTTGVVSFSLAKKAPRQSRS